MANEKNLKPVRTKSEARERGKKGGLASGKKRREKKTVSELVQIALDSSVSENGKKQIQKVMPDLDEAAQAKVHAFLVREGILSE